MRISYSSSQTYQGCPRRFYYDKVKRIEPDPDYDENTTALRLGKAFHSVLEHSFHERGNVTKKIFARAFRENEIFSETEKGYIYAMVSRYLKLQEKSEFQVVAMEVEISTKDYHGFVDAILVDSEGRWWITDLKTAKMLNNSLLSRLSRDPQLNIYSYFVPMVAHSAGVNPDLFMGTRYRVTTKPSIKKSPKETFREFCVRCYERIESYDIAIPKKYLAPGKVYNHFMELLSEAKKLEVIPEERIPQNFSYCESYFRPCPYWSKCYGATFTSAAQRFKIVNSSNI